MADVPKQSAPDCRKENSLSETVPPSRTRAQPLTVAVLGPGGVGGLLAAVLSRAGQRVICVARQDTVETLRRDGISVRSVQFGDFTARVEADTQLREPVDFCLITVKQTALDAALERVEPGALGGGVLVPLLNGIEHVDTLREYYAPQLVAPGVIRVESTRTELVVIEHGSPFTEIDLAGHEGHLSDLAVALAAAGIHTQVIEDESIALWSKLAFLAPFALLTTRYGLTIGEIRSERREQLIALVKETACVASACGAPVDPAQTLARYEAFPASSKSSMQRDAEANRPLELDAIGGAILRAAHRNGISVPVAHRLMGELATRGSSDGLGRQVIED